MTSDELNPSSNGTGSSYTGAGSAPADDGTTTTESAAPESLGSDAGASAEVRAPDPYAGQSDLQSGQEPARAGLSFAKEPQQSGAEGGQPNPAQAPYGGTGGQQNPAQAQYGAPGGQRNPAQAPYGGPGGQPNPAQAPYGAQTRGPAPYGSAQNPAGGYPPAGYAQGAAQSGGGQYAPFNGGASYPPSSGSPYQQHPGQGYANHSPPPPGYGYGQSPAFPPQARSNSKSVASLILGIAAIMVPFVGFFLGIVSIIIATISLKEIRTRGEQGSGMAIAGLICGIVGTALYFLLFVFFIIFAAMDAMDNNYYYNEYSNVFMET